MGLAREMAVLMLAVVPSLSLADSPTLSAQADAFGKLDELMIGAGITDACDASFDWKKGSENADRAGRDAYAQLLRQAKAANPSRTDNETKADQELQIRIEKMRAEGMRLVAEKTCNAPDIQDRMKRFEAEAR